MRIASTMQVFINNLRRFLVRGAGMGGEGGIGSPKNGPRGCFPVVRDVYVLELRFFSGNLDASLFVEVDSQAHETCVLSI